MQLETASSSTLFAITAKRKVTWSLYVSRRRESQKSLKQTIKEEENAVVNTAILPSSMANHIPGQGPLVVQLQLEGQSAIHRSFQA